MVAGGAAAASSRARSNEERPVSESGKVKLLEMPKSETAFPRWFFRYKVEAYRLYRHDVMQIGVAFLIIFNFLVNVVEKQADPPQVKYKEVWDAFSLFFNIVFLIELLLNMYGSWFCEFWRSAWNIFDFVVVTVGVMDMADALVFGPLKMLRMMRAFRVFRLFKRIKSLNAIVVSLIKAIPGVSNAFLIMLIVMCIFGVLGVEFFRKVGGSCGSAVSPVFTTGRDICYGEEYFGTFARCLYTLFQILTGDSWSEAVVRPITMNQPMQSYENVGANFFFVLFVIIHAFLLINVVVAVLLDELAKAGQEAETTQAAETTQEAATTQEAETIADDDLWEPVLTRLENQGTDMSGESLPKAENSMLEGNSTTVDGPNRYEHLNAQVNELTTKVRELHYEMTSFYSEMTKQVTAISNALHAK